MVSGYEPLFMICLFNWDVPLAFLWTVKSSFKGTGLSLFWDGIINPSTRQERIERRVMILSIGECRCYFLCCKIRWRARYLFTFYSVYVHQARQYSQIATRSDGIAWLFLIHSPLIIVWTEIIFSFEARLQSRCGFRSYGCKTKKCRDKAGHVTEPFRGSGVLPVINSQNWFGAEEHIANYSFVSFAGSFFGKLRESCQELLHVNFQLTARVVMTTGTMDSGIKFKQVPAAR